MFTIGNSKLSEQLVFATPIILLLDSTVYKNHCGRLLIGQPVSGECWKIFLKYKIEIELMQSSFL
jgi:hypothetical protein